MSQQRLHSTHHQLGQEKLKQEHEQPPAEETLAQKESTEPCADIQDSACEDIVLTSQDLQALDLTGGKGPAARKAQVSCVTRPS